MLIYLIVFYLLYIYLKYELLLSKKVCIRNELAFIYFFYQKKVHIKKNYETTNSLLVEKILK